MTVVDEVGVAAVVVAVAVALAVALAVAVAVATGVRTCRRLDVGVTLPSAGGVTSCPDCLVANGVKGLHPVLPMEYCERFTSPMLSISPPLGCRTCVLVVNRFEN